MKIRDLATQDSNIHIQAAELLATGCANTTTESWQNLTEALEKVKNSCAPDNISIVALEDGKVLGWASSVSQFDGNTWKLGIFAILESHSQAGLSSSLIAEIESRIIDRGGLTLWVSLADIEGNTSLFAKDLYPNPLLVLSKINSVKTHAYELYEKLGFSICGVLPDAHGFGKPEIMLSKRVRQITS